MSYTNRIGNLSIHVICAADPQKNYAAYYNEFEKWIQSENYNPKTTMDHLISMIILSFDCDDNYGEFNPETGFGGYGNEFTFEECKRYVQEHGGFENFDYYC